MLKKTFWPSLLKPSAMLVASFLMTNIASGEIVSAQRQIELTNLLRHDCGSCHGMTMKGGLGNPLLPEVLADYDNDQLVEIILEGVSGTPMPAWGELLSQKEVQWMVKQLKSGAHKRGNSL